LVRELAVDGERRYLEPLNSKCGGVELVAP
jgi:hypothetical protein